MPDLGQIMKQAQAMQEKLQEAQAKLAATTVEGTSGGGMVKLSMSGNGDLIRVTIADVLVQPGEGEVIADLFLAAHHDAKRRLEAVQAKLMQAAAGPLAGMNIPGLPKF
jgi:DNA-binding YbaB/EbfC family protein